MRSMATIYVVTAGAYSDYHIAGVFSSKEKAAKFCPLATDDGREARIEEYELDKPDESNVPQVVFTAYVNLQTGAIEEQSSYVDSVPRGDHGNMIYDGDRPQASGYSTVSPEHALKLAIEARQKHLRLHA
jgi:hypothetical protein